MALYLRENIVFKIVPMINPDGVIHGHYRTSLAGADLNRRWKTKNRRIYPTLGATKSMIKKFARERNIELVLDLHGHSRKFNSFMYGCSDKINRIKPRIFPLLFAKQCKYFSFKDCRFTMQKSKECTARIQIYKELRGKPVFFTLETSFCGYIPDPIHEPNIM